MNDIPLDPPADVVRLAVKFKAPVPEDRYLVVEHGKCFHNNAPYYVDEKLAEVRCGQCNERLNPVWVLLQMAQKETRWHESMKRYQEEMERLSKRSKTKCNHCGQMTRISHA